MSARRLVSASLLLLFGLGLACDAQAGWRRLYAQYNYPYHRATRPPATNRPALPKSTEPQDKPQQFRELAIGTQFYYVVDRDRKLFPYKKVSATHAQPQATNAGTHATLVLVPGEAMVIVKKVAPAAKPTDRTNAPPAGTAK